MSPEQAEMTGTDIDTRTDVYSLGVTLYELLVGAQVFESGTLRQGSQEDIRRRIRDTDPPRPSTRVVHLGDDSISVAKNRRTDARGLAKQPEGRSGLDHHEGTRQGPDSPLWLSCGTCR